mgnify:CR=1 FL=1
MDQDGKDPRSGRTLGPERGRSGKGRKRPSVRKGPGPERAKRPSVRKGRSVRKGPERAKRPSVRKGRKDPRSGKGTGKGEDPRSGKDAVRKGKDPRSGKEGKDAVRKGRSGKDGNAFPAPILPPRRAWTFHVEHRARFQPTDDRDPAMGTITGNPIQS